MGLNCNLQDRHCEARHNRKAPEVPCPCPDESEQLDGTRRAIIYQVVVTMWVTGVYYLYVITKLLYHSHWHLPHSQFQASTPQ